MHTITATFEVVTPMFLGGADNKGVVEFRTMSVKAGIMNSWRMLHFSREVSQHSGNVQRALETFRQREANLFGGSRQEHGQSGMIIKFADSAPPLKKLSKGSVLTDRAGYSHKTVRRGRQEYREYLYPGVGYLGYGLLKPFGTEAGRLERPCFLAEQLFSINFIFKPSVSSSDQQEVLEAIKLFGLIGGLGGRTRRGFGSLALNSLTRTKRGKLGDSAEVLWQGPETKNAYINLIQGLVRPAMLRPGTNFPMTCFASESRIDVTDWEETDPIVALNRVGKGMQNYRSWGFNGRVNDRLSERNFEVDHDWFKTGQPAHFIPERTAFGLPHRYSDNCSITGINKIDRRASPLFIHIHKTSNGEYFGLALILPTKFLPDNKVSAVGTTLPYTFDVSILAGFLDGRGTANRTGDERFFDATTILP